jgi:hypothetical protein
VAHRYLTFSAVVALVALALGLASCGDASAARDTTKNPGDPPAQPRPPHFATDDAAWGKFHSKRFQLSIPLPDGRAWRIDDHSRAELVAVHGPTSSRATLVVTQEEDLMNRQRCETRARELGHVPNAALTTVEDHVTVGPDAFDSRVWVALDAGKPGGAVEGHVFLFGAFLRRCLFVHVATAVPSAKDDDVLASRLAIARARIVRGITMDPPRTTDDATVPRDRPEIRR